jgi:uncharacterized sulfatase
MHHAPRRRSGCGLRIGPTIAVLALVGLLAGTDASSAQPAAQRPINVLLIVVDDLNTSLGCYGNTAVKSPAIDRLAARGVRFDRAYCQYPLCNPSRVSLLSGQRPEATGVYVLTTPARVALPSAVMLPQFFRQRGYHTAAAGKVFHNTRTNDDASWDAYEDGPGADPEEQAAVEARQRSSDGRPSWFVLRGDGSKTRDGLNSRTIARLMREQSAAGKPFFLAAGFHKPHLPWTAPKQFFDLYPEGTITVPPDPPMRDVPAISLQTELSGVSQPESRAAAIRGYFACVSFVDHQIGLLLDQMDQLDLWSSTVVVLLGDNGFHLGDHGGLWAKLSAFDAATHVPLIMAGAGIPAGEVVRDPVELLDIYPTLVDLAGLAADSELHGRSLTALMRGGASARSTAYSMVFHYDPDTGRDLLGRTVISSAWRFTAWDGAAGPREFYALADDPGEYRNRIADSSEQSQISEAEALLHLLPHPKSGPANRPRALAPENRSPATPAETDTTPDRLPPS